MGHVVPCAARKAAALQTSPVPYMPGLVEPGESKAPDQSVTAAQGLLQQMRPMQGRGLQSNRWDARHRDAGQIGGQAPGRASPR